MEEQEKDGTDGFDREKVGDFSHCACGIEVRCVGMGDLTGGRYDLDGNDLLTVCIHILSDRYRFGRADIGLGSTREAVHAAYLSDIAPFLLSRGIGLTAESFFKNLKGVPFRGMGGDLTGQGAVS